MAIEVGAAYVSILPSARGFSDELRRVLRGEMRSAGVAPGKDFGAGFSDSAKKGIQDGVEDGVKKSRRSAKTEGEKGGRDFGEGFQGSVKRSFGGVKTFIAAAVAGMGVKELYSTMIEAGSGAEQSSGAVAAVFKEHAGEIEKAANQAAQAVGLSANEYRELGTVLGAQLKNKGIQDFAGQTQQLIGLGADLSAQFGGSTKDAVEALTSALRGESDPIERYGVSLNEAAINAELASQGLKKVGGQWTEQQKTQARLALIMKQTSDAQGTASREAGTYEGQQKRAAAAAKNLSTTLGTALLPWATKTMEYLNGSAVPALQRFADEFKKGEGTGGQFKAFLQTLRDALQATFGFVKDNTNWLVPLVGGLATMMVVGRGLVAVTGAWNTAMNVYRAATGAAAVSQAAFNASLLASPITWIVVAIAGLIAALVLLYKNNETFRNAVDAAWQGIKDAIGSAIGWITGTAIPWLVEAWGGVSGFFSTLWDGIVTGALWLKDALAAVWGAIGSAVGFVAGVFQKVWDVLSFGIRFVAAIFLTVGLVAFRLWSAVLGKVFEGVMAVARPVFDFLVSAAGGVADFFMTYVAPLFQAAWEGIIAVFNWAKDGVAAVWELIKAGAQAVADWFMTYLAPVFQAAWNLIVAAFDFAKTVILTVWGIIQNAAMNVVDWFMTYVLPVFRAAWNGIVAVFDYAVGVIQFYWNLIQSAASAVAGWFTGTLVPWFKRIWDGISGVFSAGWNWIRDNVFKPLQDKAAALPGFFETAKEGIGKAWDGIKDKVKEPVRFVVNTVIRDGIASAWNAVADKLHLPTWDFQGVGFATGGWTGPGSKYQPAGVVHADEFVIRKESRGAIESSFPGLLDYMNQNGRMPGYADGGLVIPNPVAGATKKLLDLPFRALTGLIGRVGDQFGSSAWVQMMTAMAKWPIDKVKEFLDNLIDKLFPEIKWSGGGGSSQWASIAAQALQMTGQSMDLLPSLLRRMDQESGGNPMAINNWDSNAAAGIPSKGLMQVIDPTFAAYKMPGYDNIWDPLSNILASIRYALSRYGDLHSAYDRPGGYWMGGRVQGPFLRDQGGYLPTGVSLVANYTGQPELVLSPAQEKVARANGAAGRGDTYVLNTIDRDNVGEMVDALEHASLKASLSYRYTGGK